MLTLPLLPLSFVYCFISSIRKLLCKKKDFGIALVSVGNIVAGGSGKSPFVIELAKRYMDAAVVLRGYKRRSRGTLVVSKRGQIVCSVQECGDEAMMIAKALPDAIVIVSEDRAKAIEEAKRLGAGIVFLDDAFHKCYKKFDIVIDVEVPNPFCLPVGAYRLPRFFLRYADLVVKEGRDFSRSVTIKNPTPKMVLISAIANPKRLKNFIPKNIPCYFFEDHHYFTKSEIQKIWQKEHPTSLLVTAKDIVKLQTFGYPLSLMQLHLDIKEEIFVKIDEYKRNYYAKKDANSPNTS